jgi:hypothetical protein
VKYVSSEEQQTNERCADGCHEDGRGRHVLGAADHWVPLGPGVVDQDLERGIEQFRGYDNREAQNEADELDRREMEKERRQEHRYRRRHVEPQVCL